MVVVSLERAEQTLLAGDMPCPRCRGVLRPFGTGRTRTVRGVGADTVTVTPRRARCADCLVTQILLLTALVAHARGAGHRSIAARFEPRVHRPTVVAQRPRPARAVAVPAGCGPGRGDRPGAAGPAGAATERARARVEPARRRRTALPESVRRGRPGVGVDRLLRPRPAPGAPVSASQLKSGSRVAPPCPAVSVTVPTKVRRRTPAHRQFADQAVTSSTTQPISVFIHVDAFNGRTDDGQQLATAVPSTDCAPMTQLR